MNTIGSERATFRIEIWNEIKWIAGASWGKVKIRKDVEFCNQFAKPLKHFSGKAPLDQQMTGHLVVKKSWRVEI